MRKLVVLAAICGTALVVAVSPASTAKIDDLHGGPVCADITNDSGITEYSDGTLTFVIGTVAPACRGLTYTVSAYDDVTGVLLGTGSASGTKTAQADGSGFVIVSVPIDQSKVTSDDSFCIVATSGDDRVFDRAPDTGCISFPTDSSGGQTGFN
jgi:hypothetical protein